MTSLCPYLCSFSKTSLPVKPFDVILCSDKKDTIVKYSVLNDNKNLFASKYQLYLPTEEELVREIEKQKEEFEDKN